MVHLGTVSKATTVRRYGKGKEGDRTWESGDFGATGWGESDD